MENNEKSKVLKLVFTHKVFQTAEITPAKQTYNIMILRD